MSGKLVAKKELLRIALAVSVPLLALGLPARMADKHYDTSPWLLVAAIFVAMHITLGILIWRFRKLFHKLT